MRLIFPGIQKRMSTVLIVRFRYLQAKIFPILTQILPLLKLAPMFILSK